MTSFSERENIIKPKDVQKDTMDPELKNRIWNILYDYMEFKTYYGTFNSPTARKSIRNVFEKFFAYQTDVFSKLRDIDSVEKFKDLFFNLKFNRVYDLLEFVLNNYNFNENYKNEFIKNCNETLEKENSAYIFVNGIISSVISKTEINEIEKAMNESPENVKHHLDNALNHLSNRQNPDYSASYGESIKAIESMCKLICDNKQATLGEALKNIEKQKKVEIDPKLISGFTSIYAYSCNKQGIRHSLKPGEKPLLDIEDARFMLVTASAFINYLKVKWDKSKH